MKYLLLMLLVSFSALATREQTPVNWNTTKAQEGVQHYIHQAPNEWIKYSGAYGFGYPYKTAPQAVEYKGVVYYTYSKCITTTTQNYMIVYVANNKGGKTALRRIFSSQCDPHENASLMIDDGYIYVYQSSRGKWRKGFVFKSVNRNDISKFNVEYTGFYSYPKPHKSGLIYTDYNNGLRETWVKNKECNKKIVSGGGYAITTEVNGEIHMLYNYHFAGNLDARVNLYYMWSKNGCDWFNRDGEALASPVPENSNRTAISMDYHKFNYLKDIKFVDGEIQALVVQSTSSDPTKGSRELLKFTMDGGSESITSIGHNYDGAQFWRGNIIAIKNNRNGYAGGYLFEYTMSGEYIGTLEGLGAANYPVAVKNSDKLMFADTESSKVKSDANIYLVE